ncbi:flagellar biosynthetic protein FliR [Nitrospira sp. Nam74]
MSHTLQIALPHFQVFMVILIRVGGILAAWPILGSRVIPLHIKTGLVVTLTMVLFPIIHLPALPSDPLQLSAGMTSEFLVGLVIGLAVRFVFAGIELAGDLIGSQMGLSMIQLFDPMSAHQVPLVSQFQTVLASLIFLALNVQATVVRVIADSFDLIPPFGAHLSTALVEDVLRLSQGLFVIAMKLAAPILAVVLLVNVGLAIMGRSVPQLNVFVTSFPVTIAAGFLVMGAALPYGAGLLEFEYGRLYETVYDLMRLLRHG